jgi:hypothetical protein
MPVKIGAPASAIMSRCITDSLTPLVVSILVCLCQSQSRKPATDQTGITAYNRNRRATSSVAARDPPRQFGVGDLRLFSFFTEERLARLKSPSSALLTSSAEPRDFLVMRMGPPSHWSANSRSLLGMRTLAKVMSHPHRNPVSRPFTSVEDGSQIHGRESGNFSENEASRRRKSPPKRSLDGPPQRLISNRTAEAENKSGCPIPALLGWGCLRKWMH